MIPDELRSRRRKMYLSQAGLAARLHVTPTTVARWERGEVGIPPYLALALKWLDLEVEEERRNMTPEEQEQENRRLLRWFTREDA